MEQKQAQVIDNGAGIAYRNLLKTASKNVKMGIIRIAAAGFFAVASLIAGVVQGRIEVVLMGLLLAVITYNQFELYRMSKMVFESLTALAGSVGDDPG